MGCKPILEHHRRVVAALTLMFGVNGPLNSVLEDMKMPRLSKRSSTTTISRHYLRSIHACHYELTKIFLSID